MGTPHVCFADEQQHLPHKTASNGSLNNNNNTSSSVSGSGSQSKLEVVGHNNTPSPGGSLSVSPTPRYERNLGFFRQLSRRFGLRSQDDLVQSDDAASVATARGAGVTTTLQEEDAHSSSTDSCSSGRGLSAAHQSRLELMSMSCASSETSSTLDIEEQQEQLQQQHHQQQSQQPLQSKKKPISRASFSRLHRRSTSSLRRAFESLSLTSRSLSCSGPSPPPPPPPPPTALPLKSALKSASNVELHKQQHLQQQQQHHHHHPAGRSSSSSTSSSSSKSKVKPPPQRILRQPVSYTYLKGMSGLPTQRVPRSSVCCQYARR
ncbi:ecdysone-induced protein 75B [Drosophila gunungcola]|uniref:DUF4797 domain-containing protein n=1 Tax=Drosophila gunungcola TaxID=103775 RepID=A0A9Q0BR01_9MUSC|nr:ecdysone-induced protein 75B [Drosophila gunungcola]KAI8041392.1 hypothetical protein M5D96_005650 [Drosophila gunungcola]